MRTLGDWLIDGRRGRASGSQTGWNSRRIDDELVKWTATTAMTLLETKMETATMKVERQLEVGLRRLPFVAVVVLLFISSAVDPHPHRLRLRFPWRLYAS